MRRSFHQEAEISGKEFKTTDKIMNFLIDKGIPKESIQTPLETGLFVDIYGQAEDEGESKLVALRADIDALETEEGNKELEYRSTAHSAHLCGHDGHTVSLLGGLTLTLENLNKIPKNKGIRFIFQPEEEVITGAKKLIDKGCLKGVEEIWGLHNVPWDPIDTIFVQPGIMMFGANQIRIRIKGKGGHSSLKNELVDPFLAASKIIVKVEDFHERLDKDQKQELIPSFPLIESPIKVTNIIPEEVLLGGVIRYSNRELYEKFMVYLEEYL